MKLNKWLDICRIVAFVMCVLAPFGEGLQAANITLGTNISSAPAVADTVGATVSDGEENYFRLQASYLPATVYYFPDTAFGPIPQLVSVVGTDTLPAVMVMENCRMGWKWEIAKTAENEDERYFYFSAHENASAEIQPFICQTIKTTAPAVAACDEYVWNDTTINTSGVYTRLFTAKNGCDSVVTKTVTINHSTNQRIEVTAYESYTWINGQTYTKTIIGPSWGLQTVAGCDSTLTLDLTIRHLTRDTVRYAVCPSELPFAWQGKTYTQGGVFSTDTIKSTTSSTDTIHTLVLTLKENTFSEETLTAEDSYTWHGQTYTKSGTYTYHTANAAGCDSTVTLNLTIYIKPVVYDTIVEYYCPKSGITEHIDTTSNPRIQYRPYTDEIPRREIYMTGVLSAEAVHGANVDFARAESNLEAYYQLPLTPVTAVYWRYQKRGASSQSELTVSAQQPQWVETGTISMEVQFRCGRRYYDSFTVGDMTEGLTETESGELPAKRIENGQVVIIRGGAKYTVFGTRVE